MSALPHWLSVFSGEHVDWKQTVLIGMSPIFVVAFLIEWSMARRRGRLTAFKWPEIFANLALGGSYQIIEVLAWILVSGALFAWVYQHRLFEIPVNAWTVLPIFVLVEFSYYWFHRSSHRVRWFWSAHVVHHSGETMNFTTAMRQSLLNTLLGTFVFYLPPVWLGIPPGVVMFMLGVDLAYQYFVHTESVDRLPAWFEYVFDTPSNHRVHHGRNPQYIDRNYGGVLIIFDRLFDTWEPEVAPVDYGIPRQVRSFNFLVLNAHEFVDMWCDVAAPGRLRQRLAHLWKPPEWERPGHERRYIWTTDVLEPGKAGAGLAAAGALKSP
jgi:sterol desaturase/sphingolipid hydroxylase (fatty acid hydroxylase superfamily)